MAMPRMTVYPSVRTFLRTWSIPDGTYGEVLGGKDTNDGFWGTTIGNMYAKQMELNKRNRTNRALASAYLTVTPLKGLSWKTLVSYDYTGNSDNNFSGGIKRVNYYNGTAIDVTKGTNAYVNPSNDNDYSFGLGNNDGQTLSIQNTLTYSWKNDVHDLTVMLGNEVSRYYGQWTSASSRGFWSPDNRNVGLTTKPETLSGSRRPESGKPWHLLLRPRQGLQLAEPLHPDRHAPSRRFFQLRCRQPLGYLPFRSFGMARVRRSFHAESGRGFQPEAPSWLGTNR